MSLTHVMQSLERRKNLLGRFRQDDHFYDLRQEAALHGLLIQPVFRLQEEGYIIGYYLKQVMINDFRCGIYRVAVEEYAERKFRWCAKILAEQLYKFNFLILEATDLDEEKAFFIIPTAPLQQRSRGMTHYLIHIPLEAHEHRGRPPIYDWQKTKGAWYQLQRLKQASA